MPGGPLPIIASRMGCLPKLDALVSVVVSGSFTVEELGLPQELMADWCSRTGYLAAIDGGE